MKKIRVAIWNEYVHEQAQSPAGEYIRKIYPHGIHRYLAEALAALPVPEPDKTVISRRMEMQLHNAKEWCDIINTFFHRLSGVADAHGRTIYP